MRIIKPIRTQSKSTKPLNWDGGNTLAIYTFLQDVEYQVEAHFEWNEHRPDLAGDRIAGKHLAIAERMLARGGRQDIFLGTRDCQGYVEPCEFGSPARDGNAGFYDTVDNLDFGLMFHSFAYPEETGKHELLSRFWPANMQNGVITFPSTQDDSGRLKSRVIRTMLLEKAFVVGANMKSVEDEAKELGL